MERARTWLYRIVAKDNTTPTASDWRWFVGTMLAIVLIVAFFYTRPVEF